jgi:hypothetical protein
LPGWCCPPPRGDPFLFPSPVEGGFQGWGGED